MVHPQHRVLQDIPENLGLINELMQMDHLELTEIAFTDLKDISIS